PGRQHSCVRVPRLLGKRAPARGIPMLWGKTCPAFARWMVASIAAQPSRLRTLPGLLGNRGNKGLEIQMRRQKRRVQVTLHWPNPTGTRMRALGERLPDVGATAMAILREPGTLGGDFEQGAARACNGAFHYR